MTMSTDVLPAVRTAFGRLIDYAGLFPPAKLSMAPAAAAYDAARLGAHAWMLGRFVVPASRLAELADAARDLAPFALSVIVDNDAGPQQWFEAVQDTLRVIAAARASAPPVHIEALEVPLPPLASQRETFGASIAQFAVLAERFDLRDLPVYAELPRNERWRALLSESMTSLMRARFGAKLRCGGLVPSAVPPVEDVAAFISAAVAENVPFKATAGLHHPVRHFNEAAGFTMHGFLNILAASVFARRVSEDDLRAIIAEEDPAAFHFDAQTFAWRDQRANMQEIAAMREHAFVGYGSCSFAEPVDDLTALSILPKTI
jgi:hypothetical protein